MNAVHSVVQCVLRRLILVLAAAALLDQRVTSAQTPTNTTDATSAQLLNATAITARWSNAPLRELNAAAQSGDASAETYLASRLALGLGGKTNLTEAAQLYRRAAEQGFAHAQFELGWMYERGRGVDKNRELAMDWTRRAAEQGYTAAEVNLGWMYAHDQVQPGQTITGNYPVAAEWYEKAARKGHANAQYLLAELYHTGKLGHEMRSNCVPWYLNAAQQGHTKAQAEVGKLSRYYPNSDLLRADTTIEPLRRSAEKGNLTAQMTLSRRHESGDGTATNLIEAFKWMKMASENSAQSSVIWTANYELACMYENGLGVATNLPEAWKTYLIAAEGEYPDALFRVGRMYEEATGVPRDLQKAAEYYFSTFMHGWGSFDVEARYRLLLLYSRGEGLPGDKSELERRLEKLASFRDARTQFLLGEVYAQGKGVPANLGVAVEHYTQAAKLGSAEAQNQIGEMWAAGLQGAPDLREASTWYRKAAQQGLAKAQFNLALCYRKGEGVAFDPVEAWQWYALAARQGHAEAPRQRDELGAQLTPAQLNEAKAKVARFNPTPRPGP